MKRRTIYLKQINKVVILNKELINIRKIKISIAIVFIWEIVVILIINTVLEELKLILLGQ